MNKIYIIDTNVLIDDPYSFQKFKNCEVILPIAVVDELDKLKKDPSAGKGARVAIKLLDEVSNLGDVSTGVLMDGKCLLKIDVGTYSIDQGDPLYGDTRILACAKHYHDQGNDVTVISNDFNLRVRAKATGIFAESYEREGGVSFSELYEGIQDIVHEEAGYTLLEDGVINPIEYDFNLLMNESVCLLDNENNIISVGRKVAHDQVKFVKKSYPWNLNARNKEQAFAIDLIMDPNIDLITLTGSAGCGKSLVALAAGLELVINQRKYNKLTIYRPMQAVGAELGYLPGSEEEKLAPWFEAIMDSFEVLFTNNQTKSNKGKDWRRDLEMYIDKEVIEMNALTFIRGRSIPNAIICLDEAQNISKEDMKTILTRAGEGTKIIITGDLEQIDNKFLDSSNNGLAYVIEKFKGSDIFGHITFVEGERSRLASEAADLL